MKLPLKEISFPFLEILCFCVFCVFLKILRINHFENGNKYFLTDKDMSQINAAKFNFDLACNEIN